MLRADVRSACGLSACLRSLPNLYEWGQAPGRTVGSVWPQPSGMAHSVVAYGLCI